MKAAVAPNPVICKVASDADVVVARQLGRQIAGELGFQRPDQALIATAISELARNIVNYARSGWVEIGEFAHGRRRGLKVIATDSGPGIADLDAAMTDGFSTGKSLGLGLPGTRRLMDEFLIASEPGKGVKVTIVKWLR